MTKKDLRNIRYRNRIITSSFILVILFGIVSVFLISNLTKANEIKLYGNNWGNLNTFGLVVNDDSNFYYMSFQEDTPKLKMLNLDGQITTIYENLCLYLNIKDDSIFYINGENNMIYKMDKNDLKHEKISDVKASFLYIYENQVYIIGFADNQYGKLYAMEINGDNLRLLAEEAIEQFVIDNNFIYFTTVLEKKVVLYRMNIDGSGKEKIDIHHSGDISWFYIQNNNLYYCDSIDGKGVRRYDISNQSTDTFNPPIPHYSVILREYINYQDNIVVYRDLYNNTFNKLNLDTKEIISTPFNINDKVEALGWVYPTNLYMAGEKVYYYNNQHFYMMDLDGTNKIKID